MYTLITNAGKVYVFSILGCAEMYQRAYGGKLITNVILEEVKVSHK